MGGGNWRRIVCLIRGHVNAITVMPEDGWGLYRYSRLFCSRCDLTFDAPYPFAELARYNSERSRGIVHASEFAARMTVQQRYFDERH